MLSAPSNAMDNPVYGALVDTVLAGKRHLREATIITFDGSNGGFWDHSLEYNAGFSGMQVVSKSGGPFEVVGGIVGLDEVPVVYLGETGLVLNKCCGYQTVNGHLSLEGGFPQENGEVAHVVLKLHESSFDHLGRIHVVRTIEASDSSEIADFVQISGKAWEDDWSPLLGDHGIHAAGFLSARRLEIKDPSRDATLGGFAFDSAHGRHSQENDGGLRCQ